MDYEKVFASLETNTDRIFAGKPRRGLESYEDL